MDPTITPGSINQPRTFGDPVMENPSLLVTWDPRAAQPPFGPCVTGGPAGLMQWPWCDSNDSMGFQWDFYWISIGFLWDFYGIADLHGMSMKFNAI